RGRRAGGLAGRQAADAPGLLPDSGARLAATRADPRSDRAHAPVVRRQSGGGRLMSVILTRAPLRISLGGGGTDLPSYYRRYGGFIVSGAIDKYVYMLTHTVFPRRYRLKYSEFEEVDTPAQHPHPIL